jgi:hypothetical protein
VDEQFREPDVSFEDALRMERREEGSRAARQLRIKVVQGDKALLAADALTTQGLLLTSVPRSINAYSMFLQSKGCEVRLDGAVVLQVTDDDRPRRYLLEKEDTSDLSQFEVFPRRETWVWTQPQIPALLAVDMDAEPRNRTPHLEGLVGVPGLGAPIRACQARQADFIVAGEGVLISKGSAFLPPGASGGSLYTLPAPLAVNGLSVLELEYTWSGGVQDAASLLFSFSLNKGTLAGNLVWITAEAESRLREGDKYVKYILRFPPVPGDDVDITQVRLNSASLFLVTITPMVNGATLTWRLAGHNEKGVSTLYETSSLQVRGS